MAKHSKQTQYIPENAAVKQAFDPNQYAPVPKKRKGSRALLITLGVIVAILVLAYLIGVWLFTFMFMPNSKISSFDVSLKTATSVEQELSSNFKSFSINVTGSDLNFKIDAASAGISADTNKIVKDALANVDTWRWPLEMMNSHDYSKEISANLSQGNLGTIVQEKVDVANQNKQESTDAHLTWNQGQSSFVVESETYGTKIDAKSVENKITDAIISMQSSVMVSSDDYIKPTILKTDTRWDSALTQANVYGKANFKIMMGTSEAATVNGSVIKDWIDVGDNLNVTLNSDRVSAWADSIAEGCNTVGSERTYTRPDGNKTFTVSGGTYGWVADGSGLADEIVNAVNSGSTSSISVNVTQSANALVPAGQADWGGRWIDVDLAEQHAYMYDNGSLIWDTDIVSGDPTNEDKTPTGVWMVNAKRTNETLKGPMKNGTPEWESVVAYWMPFINNNYGLHDASWQSYFGSVAYTIHNWSHGCVNLPTAKAAAIYDLCQVGDAVIVHY